MNPMLNRGALEDFSASLPLTLKVQLAWSEILARTILTKAVVPLAGFYPDFALPDLKGIAEVRQDYGSDVCQRLADISRLPVISRDQRNTLEELLNEPAVLLTQSFADLDRWENRARRHLEEFRKLSGKLEEATEIDLAEHEDHFEEDE